MSLLVIGEQGIRLQKLDAESMATGTPSAPRSWIQKAQAVIAMDGMPETAPGFLGSPP